MFRVGQQGTASKNSWSVGFGFAQIRGQSSKSEMTTSFSEKGATFLLRHLLNHLYKAALVLLAQMRNLTICSAVFWSDEENRFGRGYVIPLNCTKFVPIAQKTRDGL